MKKLKNKPKKKSKSFLFKRKNFKATKNIGKGSFGKVYLGRTLDNNKECAIKKIFLGKIKGLNVRRSTQLEIEIMKQVHHENVIELFFVEPENFINREVMEVFVIMEYCDMGSLRTYLEDKKNKKELIPIEEIKEIFTQTVRALKYLYDQRIIHRDLKPANILLKKDPKSKFGYTIKVCDFGLSKQIKEEEMKKSLHLMSTVGTPSYMAPEVLLHESYSWKADFWSLGAILYEMLTGNAAFKIFLSKNLKKQFKKVTVKSLPKKFLKKYPKECNDLVQKLLTVNPKQRISREELYKHKFLNNALDDLSKDISLERKKQIGILKSDYITNNEKEISLKKGEYVEIIAQLNEKEFRIKFQEKEGNIPIYFLEIYEEIGFNEKQEELFKIIQKKADKIREGKFIAIAKWDFSKSEEREIALKKGDCVEIIEIKEEGWFIVKLLGKEGYCHFDFLYFYEKIENPSNNKEDKIFSIDDETIIFNDEIFGGKDQIKRVIKRKKMVAMKDYEAQKQDELSFRAGDVVQITFKNYEEWWEGIINNQKGYFPITYFKDF
ncbi:serine/threonine-protein kinase unc-51-related [Anaeramoeba ignava]|uniref:Serine/threonine-protein kinase unc-51-related n=1 Tax=Anaeramoeba ignava TaxID=1746090 RepID=A0A9Q0LA61_ANAIG|nr:serine/threonine-protein kinase unc-51-related [Anaeramoeba ignava]